MKKILLIKVKYLLINYYRGQNIKVMSDYAEHQLIKCYFNNIEPEVKTGSAKN